MELAATSAECQASLASVIVSGDGTLEVRTALSSGAKRSGQGFQYLSGYISNEGVFTFSSVVPRTAPQSADDAVQMWPDRIPQFTRNRGLQTVWPTGPSARTRG